MDLSVLIGTRDRPRLLVRCLKNLARQINPPSFEVVVAIDGEDAYAEADLETLRHKLPYPLVVVHSHDRYQAAAVNRALEEARGELVLIMGDDIFGDPHLIERHVERHRTLDDRHTAVQGRVGWHPELLPDPFLDWETKHGIQFAYNQMQEHAYVPLKFFFGCNVSLRRDWFTELGGFDGSLPSWMDTIFSFHAGKQGLKLYYDPDAYGDHFHHWTLDEVCRRRYGKGRTAVNLLREHPDFADHVLIPLPGKWRTFRHAVSHTVRPLAQALGWKRVLGWCWIHEIHYQFTRGMRDETKESAS